MNNQLQKNEFGEFSSDEEHGSDSNFMETIEQYNEIDFKSNLKLNRSTVEQLIANYSQSDVFLSKSKPKIGPRKEVYLYVWYICHTLKLKELANLFGVAKPTACIVVGRVSTWLVEKGKEYIKWPQGDVIEENSRKFEAMKKIPGVIGAIDCIHIEITPPETNKYSYLNLDDKFSIILQAVVDADNKFIDVCCGEPGSLNEREVLTRSTLYIKALNHYNRLFPSNTYLLGNSEYDSSNWIVAPFEDSAQLTDNQKSFNSILMSTWTVVCTAFRLLSSRFRKINNLYEENDLSLVKKIVVSACVLHNLCIISSDDFTLDDETTFEGNSTGNRLQELFLNMCEQNIL